MPLYQPTAAGVSDHGALTGLADDDHTAYSTNAEFDDHSARHEDGGADEISIAALSGTPVAVTDHLNDATDAHDASAISVLDTAAVFTATEVETALKELYDAITGGGIPGTIFNAKGDLIGASAADTPSLLTVGANGTALVAASGETTGLKWGTPALPSGVTRVETDESLTGNNSFADLATSGPAVTITVNTKVLVTVGAETFFSVSSAYGAMGYAVSGANTIAAARAKSFLASSGGGGGAGAITGASRSFMLTGLTPGSTTFTAKYNQLGGAGQTNWQSRELSVVCLD